MFISPIGSGPAGCGSTPRPACSLPPRFPPALQILNAPAKLAPFELRRHQTADITAYFPNMLAAAMLENEINFNKQSLCVDLSWMQLLVKLRHGVRRRGGGRSQPPLCRHTASSEHEGSECTAGGGGFGD